MFARFEKLDPPYDPLLTYQLKRILRYLGFRAILMLVLPVIVVKLYVGSLHAVG